MTDAGNDDGRQASHTESHVPPGGSAAGVHPMDPPIGTSEALGDSVRTSSSEPQQGTGGPTTAAEECCAAAEQATFGCQAPLEHLTQSEQQPASKPCQEQHNRLEAPQRPGQLPEPTQSQADYQHGTRSSSRRKVDASQVFDCSAACLAAPDQSPHRGLRSDSTAHDNRGLSRTTEMVQRQ